MWLTHIYNRNNNTQIVVANSHRYRMLMNKNCVYIRFGCLLFIWRYVEEVVLVTSFVSLFAMRMKHENWLSVWFWRYHSTSETTILMVAVWLSSSRVENIRYQYTDTQRGRRTVVDGKRRIEARVPYTLELFLVKRMLLRDARSVEPPYVCLVQWARREAADVYESPSVWFDSHGYVCMRTQAKIRTLQVAGKFCVFIVAMKKCSVVLGAKSIWISYFFFNAFFVAWRDFFYIYRKR